VAKASYWNGSDGEERKLGDQMGLDSSQSNPLISKMMDVVLETPVVPAVNDARLTLQPLRRVVVSERRC
jgi:hypothetical protein